MFGLQAPTKKQAPTTAPITREQAPKTDPGTPSPKQAEHRTAYQTTITPQQLSATDFEDLVQRLYTEMGYSARRTQQTRDGGVDVIAIRDHPTGRDKLAIQCKRQLYPVGRPELQKLLGVITADPSFSAGIMVTTSTFSADALQFAQMNARIKMVDKNTLARLLVQYRVPVRKSPR